MGIRFTSATIKRIVSGVLPAFVAALSLASTGTSTYAQTQPKGGHTVEAATNIGAPADCTMSFSDVQPGDYFYDGLQYLYCRNDVSGYSDGTFRPGNNATRGQVSKIVVLAEGWALSNPAAPSFSDVAPGSVYYSYVETARAHGVINGYTDGTFHINDNISRGQLAKIVALSQGWSLLNPATPSFSDVPAGSAFYTYVETAVSKGVLSGYTDGTFRPGSLATRGQICKVVYYAVTGTTPLPPAPSPTPVGVQLTPEEQATVDLINTHRVAMGLAALRIDPALTLAARGHSADIGPQGLCQHEGTNGSSPWDRIAQSGYTGFGSGEVVGCNYNSAQSVVDGWWNSPAHYGILTGAAINDIGCGWWLNSQGYGWQTCDVGTSSR